MEYIKIILIPIITWEDRYIFLQMDWALTQSDDEKWTHRYLQERKTWGTYEIKGDTVKASIYYNFANPIVNNRIANFEGIIKNRDTILQWHLVEFYPKLNKSTKETFDFLFKGKWDLYFKPLSIKPYMDSVSENAWILKYRDKK